MVRCAKPNCSRCSGSCHAHILCTRCQPAQHCAVEVPLGSADQPQLSEHWQWLYHVSITLQPLLPHTPTTYQPAWCSLAACSHVRMSVFICTRLESTIVKRQGILLARDFNSVHTQLKALQAFQTLLTKHVCCTGSTYSTCSRGCSKIVY